MVTLTKKTQDKEKFEEILRANLRSIVSEYAEQHDFFMEKYNPIWWKAFISDNNDRELMWQKLEEVSDNSYKTLRSVFREAHNFEAREDVELSAEFQKISDKLLSTRNEYPEVRKLLSYIKSYDKGTM